MCYIQWEGLSTCGYLNLNKLKLNKVRNLVPQAHQSHFKGSRAHVARGQI